MGKFIRENETANKQTFTSLAMRLRADSKNKPDTDGKTEYQKAKDAIAHNEVQSLYAQLMKATYSALSTERKREIYNRFDSGTQQQGINRAKRNLKSTIENSPDITRDMVFACAKKYVTEAKNYDELLGRIKPLVSEQEYRDLEYDPKPDRVEILMQNLSEEKKTYVIDKYYNSIVYAPTLEEAKKIASDLLPEEEISKMEYSELNITPLNLDMFAEDIFKTAANDLSEEQIESISTTIDNTVPAYERDWEESGVHPLAENTAKMQEKIRSDENLSQQEKDRIIAQMTKINADIIDTPISNAMNMNRGPLESALEKDMVKVGQEALKAQNVDPDAVKMEFDMTTMKQKRVVSNEDDFHKMQNMDMRFSDKTRNAVKEIFGKFEEYGYVNKNAMGEDGFKAYAMTDYYKTMLDYQKALESGDAEKSAKLAEELTKHNEQIHELLGIVKENFPIAEGEPYPGNVDVLRNKELPVDLRKDIRSVAELNGLYIAYGFIKSRGLDVDEFLDNPVKYVSDFYRNDYYKTFEPTEIIKGKSGADAIFDLTVRTRESASMSGYGATRTLEALKHLERDPELKQNNYAAETAFTKATYEIYADFGADRKERIDANRDVLDRFFIVKEPQLDGKLLGSAQFYPMTNKEIPPTGFDEAEYIAQSAETSEEFYERLKGNVNSLMDKNYAAQRGDETLENREFIAAAQKAAAKYIMIKGLSYPTNTKNMTPEQEANKALFDFVTNGKEVVSGWVDERGLPESEATNMKNTVAEENPYARMIGECSARVRSQMSKKGDTRAYAEIENKEETLDGKKRALTNAFRNGSVPESFYKARMGQLEVGDENAKMPPFFAADSLPKRDDYIRQTYGEENANELSVEEKEYIYDRFKESARQEKREFLTKQYMLEKNLVRKGEFFTADEMEEMYPAAREEAKQAEKEYRERVAAEQKAAKEAEEAENALSRDERLKFVRQGETVTKETFPVMMERYLAYTHRERSKDPDKTEIENAWDRKDILGDNIRGNALIDSIREKLSPEDTEGLLASLPEKNKETIYRNIGKKLEMATGDIYYQKKDRCKELPDGREKNALLAEIAKMDEIKRQLIFKINKPEDAIRLAKPYIDQEKFDKLDLTLTGNAPSSFFARNASAIAKNVTAFMSEEDLKAIAENADRYVVPWERKPEEMGKTVYDAQTEQAKQEITERKDLDDKTKARMIENLDKANDFLRTPTENDFEAYLSVSTDFQNGSLRVGGAAGSEQMLKEGLDKNIVEERLDPVTGHSNVILKEGKEAEKEKWEKAEFRMSPETKSSIKHIFDKMHEFGYDKAGVVGEEGMSKEYGLKPLGNAIRAYKNAVKTGDAAKIAEAAEKMNAERAHVDEMLAFIKENFPVTKDNFAIAGNIEVVRNDLFPPYLRYDDAAVTHLNSLYIAMNFAKANGIEPEEFITNPAKYMRETYQDKMSGNLDHAIADKSGAAALFEICKSANAVKNMGGESRAFEGMRYFDKDPEIRAHNHGLGEFLEQTVANNAQREINDRSVAYRDPNSRLDRLLFVSEPQKDASILGVSYYVGKDLKFKEAEPFDEFAYLSGNGKWVGDMKDQIDRNIVEYLRLNAEIRLPFKSKDSTQAITQEEFLEIAQSAAKKVLMAKSAERGTPEYEALKGLLTDGNKYVNDLLKTSKLLSDDTRGKIRFKAKGDVKYARDLDEFTSKVENFEKVAKDELDFKPDRDFNKSMKDQTAALKVINDRIEARKSALGNDADPAKDDEIQILSNQKEKKLAEINRTKTEYLESLKKDVLSGRVPNSFKEARVRQVSDPSYEFDSLPDPFPKAELLSKADYIKQLEESGALKDKDGNDLYDENDKNDLYEAYVDRVNRERDAEIEEFSARKKAEEFGMTAKNAEVDKTEVKAEAKVDEPKKEEIVRTSFSGRWFKENEKFDKEAFLAKLNGIEAAKKAEPQGENWYEKHQSIEAVENDVQRLKYFYDNAYKKLSQKGREAVFETLSAENKRHANGKSLEQYSKILQGKNTPEATKVAEEIKKGKSNNMTVAEAEKLAAPFMTEEEKKDPLLRPYNHIANYALDVKGETGFWKPIVDNLSKEDLETLAYETEAHAAPLEREFDEVLVERYTKETEEVKDILAGMQNYNGEPLTEERREKIFADLDKAKELTSDLDDKFSYNLGLVRGDREEGKYGMNWERSRVAEEILRSEGIDFRIGGQKSTTTIFNGTAELNVDGFTDGGEPYEMFQLKEGYEEQYRKLRDKKIILSDKTKDAIKTIFKKFDEYGFDEGEFNPEETNKVYGLHRYAKAFNEYIDKINSPDPVIKAQAVAAAEKMVVEHDRVKEIIGIAKDSFGLDKGGFYAGNMDAEREILLPPDIRADLSGTSTLNGLYLMYRTLKSQNVDLDQFLNDPRAHFNKETEEVLKKLDPNESVKGKKGAEAIMAIVTPSNEIDKAPKLRLGRAVECISKLETDPELSRNNMAAEYSYSMTGQMELEVAPHRDELLRCASRHLDRYLMVREPQEDASLMGFPTYDFETMRAIKPKEFDEVEYLWNLQDTPDEYLDRIVTEGTKVLEQIKDREKPLMGLFLSDVVHMMQTAAIKYLVVHPELGKNTEAYKGLLNVAQGPVGVEKILRDRVDNGKMDIDVDKFNFGSMSQYGVNNTYAEFVKSAAIKNFGSDVIRADTQANRNLKNLQNNVTKAQRDVDRAKNDDLRRQAQDRLDSAKKDLNDAVSARKEQLRKDFEDGKTTESYFNRRLDQLDKGKFGDKLPTMFEADRPKSKNEFLSERVDPKTLNRMSNVEKQGLYETYLNGCKRDKDIFIARKYLESENMIDEPKKTVVDENAKVKEDKKLENKSEQKPEVDKNIVEEERVEKIDVDLNEEPEVKAEEKGEKDKEDPEKAEEKQEEAPEENRELGEKVSIDLNEEEPELNDDILSFGKEKEKSLDSIEK